MRHRIVFTALAEPVVGGSVEVEGTVTYDGPMPRAIPIRLNGHPIPLPVQGNVVRIRIDFPAPATATVAPADGFEGLPLHLKAE